MRTYCIVLSFLLMQSCIYCRVINPNSDSYEIIDVSQLQGDAANKAYWQEAHMLLPEQVEQNSWLKYLSEEFRRALKDDGTETKMQKDMYQQQSKNAQYDEPKRDATMEVYREAMADRDAMPDWERAKVKKSTSMDMMKTKKNYPQYVNYISKQADVRSPETVFVTFPEHTQILDEFGRVVGTAPQYLEIPQRYTEQAYSKMPQQFEEKETEQKEHKKTGQKKPQEKAEKYETEKQEKRYSSEEKADTEREMKSKHDKKEDKHKKQSMTKQKEDMQNKTHEHNTSQLDKRSREEEELTPNTYTQNQARYKTPLRSAHDLLLAKLNGPFAFGKNVM